MLRSLVRVAPAVLLILACQPTPQLKPSPSTQHAAVKPSFKGGRGFEQFCAGWIAKLRQRHKKNERTVKFERKGKLFVGEFTGYGSKPLRCKAQPTGKPVSPLVGRMAYHEIQYQKSGTTRAKASKSRPRELYRVEVTELFRYDGSSWLY